MSQLTERLSARKGAPRQGRPETNRQAPTTKTADHSHRMPWSIAHVPSGNRNARNDTVPSTITASRAGGRPGSITRHTEFGVPYPGIPPRRTNARAAATGSAAPWLVATSAKSNPPPRPRHTGSVAAPDLSGVSALLDTGSDPGTGSDPDADADADADAARVLSSATAVVPDRLAHPDTTALPASTTQAVEIDTLDPGITTSHLPRLTYRRDGPPITLHETPINPADALSNYPGVARRLDRRREAGRLLRHPAGLAAPDRPHLQPRRRRPAQRPAQRPTPPQRPEP